MDEGDRWYHGWLDRLAARWPATERRRSLAAGLGFGTSAALLVFFPLVVLLIANLGSRGSSSVDLSYIAVFFRVPLWVGLAAALSGAPLWWKIVEQPAEPTGHRGGLVGAVVGVVTTPMMWLLAGVGMGIGSIAISGKGALVDLVLGDPGGLLLAFAGLSDVGLIFTGIVTVPVAATTGVALARVRRKAAGTSHGPDRRRPDDL